MRKVLMTVAAVSMTFVTTGFAAEADGTNAIVPPAPAVAGQVTATTVDATALASADEEIVIRGQSQRSVMRSGRQRGRFVDRLVEFERRKNAWLRRTFLNR